MQFADLSAVKHRVHLGAPLPFNVRNADKTLLLARGQKVDSPEHLAALLARGALVDLAELMSPRDEVMKAPREMLPRLWSDALSKIGSAMDNAPEPGFCDALVEAAGPVQALIERDPDLAIFQVLQKGADANTSYGAQRSTQTAITCMLVAQRMGWSASEAERAFKVALTMNLAMLELQGLLSRQTTPLTPEQRVAIHSHPLRSAHMLELAGVTDSSWIEGVRGHHELEDGSGYPTGNRDAGELAMLVRRADIYTAKLSARASRPPMRADTASRQMFMQDPGHPITVALVKEFGIYPPGCQVHLASGETGVVVARGATITAPIVACFTNERGALLNKPVRRDTSAKGYAVAGAVDPKVTRQSPPVDKLMAAVATA